MAGILKPGCLIIPQGSIVSTGTQKERSIGPAEIDIGIYRRHDTTEETCFRASTWFCPVSTLVLSDWIRQNTGGEHEDEGGSLQEVRGAHYGGRG
jgi:hypothetical protein